MSAIFTEDTYEQAIIELFENMGYEHLYAPDLELRLFQSAVKFYAEGLFGAALTEACRWMQLRKR